MPTVKKRKQWSIWRYEYAYDEYRKVEPMRQKVSDCLQGEEYVKSKEEYLRKTQWYKKHNDEYQAFVARATFYSKTSYALRVYEGLVTAGEPEILLPENGGMDFLRRYATVYKNDLHSLQVRLNRDQFTSGLRVMVAEPTADDKNPFVIKEYGASSFLRAYFVDMDGESVAKFVLMDESTMAFDIKTKSSTFKERIIRSMDSIANHTRPAFAFAGCQPLLKPISIPPLIWEMELVLKLMLILVLLIHMLK